MKRLFKYTNKKKIVKESSMYQQVKFLWQFITKPRSTGAILPSSRFLARKMISWLPFSELNAVAEFGPGTGSFTKHLLRKLSHNTRFLAVELNPDFVKLLSSQFPALSIYHDSVTNIRSICDRENISQLDAIVSGLPWANFPEELQMDILDSMMTVLKNGGRFCTFAYLQGLALPAAKKFRKRLDHYFSTVRTTMPVLLNIPPAVCYHCIR